MKTAIAICLSPWIAVIAVAVWHAWKTNPNNESNHHHE